MKQAAMQSNIIDSAMRLPAGNPKSEVSAWFDLAERWGISHTVAAPPDEFVMAFNDEGNAMMADLVKQYPDRLSALAVANPWYGEKAVDTLKRAFERGLCGLYLHPGRQGFHLTESVVDPLIEACLEYGKPIYSHTGTPICAMPFQLAELARRFGEATFVMGHMGWTDFCGYDAVPAAQQTPNILLDTSLACSSIVADAIEKLGVGRVLFGTGYPRSRPAHEFEKLKPLNLSEEDFDKYARKNARRIWKINP